MKTRKGDPMRFVHEVAIHHVGDGCLIWPFGKNNKGYALLWVDGRDGLATRYICTLVNGEPPTSEHEAAHSCGKGHEGCVSPIHLGWKTAKENQDERLIHGTHCHGDRSPNSKLTNEQAMKVLSLKGKVSQREIAAEFGISQMAVSRIHSRRTYKVDEAGKML